MDRRTKLAVLLIAAILGLNLAITARTQKQRALLRRSVTETTLPATPAPTPMSDSRGATNTPSAGAPAVEGTNSTAAPGGPFANVTAADVGADLVIDTPLQRLRISRVGGLIRELSLHKYMVTGTTALVDLARESADDPSHRALGIVLRSGSNTWSLANARFEPAPGTFGSEAILQLAAGSGPRTFEMRCEAQGGGALVEQFTIDPDHYDFQVALRIEPGAGLSRADSYTLEWTTGMPSTENNPREHQMRLRAVVALDDQLLRKRPTDFRREPSLVSAGTLKWSCLTSKYFMVGIIPTTPQHGTLELMGQDKAHWLGMRFTQPAPWRTGDSYRIYAGPIAYDQVRALGVGLDSAAEMGWRWIRPISEVLLHFMQFVNRFIPNYGIVIIIVSALAKLVFWPLTAWSMRSMRRMQQLQPRTEEIRRRYSGDPKAMNEQMMNMYKEQRVSPVGGCAPMLLQTPIFFALYSVLNSNIELRGAPFLGWINNLAAPDVLAKFPVALPVLGENLSLLPLLMGGASIWQSIIGTPMMPTSGGAPNPMAQQQFMMKWMMPIMMTFIFYKMPSGLVLYWIVNTLMTVAQQVHMNRGNVKTPNVVTAVASAAVSGSEGGANHGGPTRIDGPERGRSATERANRAGRQTR